MPIVFTALPRQLRIMAKAALGYVPFIGWHLLRGGHVLVNRKNPGAGIFKRMQRMARAGASLIVFPGGRRGPSDGQSGSSRPASSCSPSRTVCRRARHASRGSRLVMPKGRLAVHPATRGTSLCTTPIPTAGLTREDARAGDAGAEHHRRGALAMRAMRQ